MFFKPEGKAETVTRGPPTDIRQGTPRLRLPGPWGPGVAGSPGAECPAGSQRSTAPPLQGAGDMADTLQEVPAPSGKRPVSPDGCREAWAPGATATVSHGPPEGGLWG